MANREQECTDAPILEDDRGEYPLDRGSTEPTEGKCNAVLRYTWSRFGERRYCQMPEGWRTERTDEFCRWHSERKDLRDHRMKEDLIHGAYVESYKRLLNVMPLHKQITAITLFKSLREESVEDFEGDSYTITVNTEGVDWYDEDDAEIEIPVAKQSKRTREKALLKAALEFVKMESIDEQIFADAYDDEEGVGLGEKEFVIDVVKDDDGEVIKEITGEDEHHLNLPVSRMLKDFKDCLAFGGVSMESDDEGEVTNVDARSFNVDLGPKEDDTDVQPEQRVPEDERIEIKEPHELE